MSDNTQIVGAKIKSLRETKEITIAELAERTGLAEEQINRIENNVDIPSLAPLIKIARAPKKHVLTDTLLETLSIIAYKQPITRTEIERVRGVSCDHAVNKLLEYGLIMELGRMDAPGRPLLFGTTEQFLRSFGVHSVNELPVLSPVQLEEFKQEAEEEMKVQLEI